MTQLLKNPVLWGIVITFVISGLSAITGMVSPHTAVWIAFVVSALTGVGHTTNILPPTTPTV